MSRDVNPTIVELHHLCETIGQKNLRTTEKYSTVFRLNEAFINCRNFTVAQRLSKKLASEGVLCSLIDLAVEGSNLSYLAVRLLRNFAVDERARRSIVHHDFVSVCMAILAAQGDWLLQLCILEFLCGTIADDAVIRAVVRSDKCIPALLSVIGKGSSSCPIFCSSMAMTILTAIVGDRRSRLLVMQYERVIADHMESNKRRGVFDKETNRILRELETWQLCQVPSQMWGKNKK